MPMITPLKAWELIAVGESVFYHDGKVVSAEVKKVDLDHIVTDDGVLYYQDHGQSWWLTEKVAKEKLEECRRNKYWF